MTAPTADRTHAGVRRGGGLAAAAVAWVVLYPANLRFGQWLVGDVAGVNFESRVGDSVLFFVYDTSKIALLLTGIIVLDDQVGVSGRVPSPDTIRDLITATAAEK
jgi:hypothetical protein